MFSRLIKTGIGHSGMDLLAVSDWKLLQSLLRFYSCVSLKFLFVATNFRLCEFSQEQFFVWPFEISHNISTKFHLGDELLPVILLDIAWKITPKFARNFARTKTVICQISFALLLHNTVHSVVLKSARSHYQPLFLWNIRNKMRWNSVQMIFYSNACFPPSW